MTLHVTNGDCTADTLRLVVSDPVAITCDVLHDGPCPPVDGDAWHDVRAQFLSDAFGLAFEDVKAGLAATDETIAGAPRITLWFEHDLFDQLLLIRTLDLMVRLKPETTEATAGAPTEASSGARTETSAGASVVSGLSRTLPRVSLICIGSFPGIDRFLGQLTADQLATLTGSGVPVIAGHFALARDAWRAFRSPDPTALLELARQLDAARAASSEGGPVLPFLGDALLRFLAEYPSTANGLSRTEALALQELVDGPLDAGALFSATRAREARPFLGDLPFFDNLDRLASARVPLVTIEGSGERRQRRIDITAAGRDVFANRADHLRLNGIDLWRGGVHLSGSDDSPWRWDAGAETLVS